MQVRRCSPTHDPQQMQPHPLLFQFPCMSSSRAVFRSEVPHCRTSSRALISVPRADPSLEDGNDWQLADETNVPECWGRHESQSSDRCNVSERYLRHLKAAELGLGSDEEYTNHERYLDEIENPRMILGDLEPRAVTRPPHDAGLVQHMRALRLLQGARGRLVMNDFLHEDPAAQQRLKGVCAGLDGTIGAKVTQRDKQQLELEESKRVLEKLRRGVIEGRQQLQQVEDERRVTTDSLRPGEQNPIIPDSQFTSIPHPASGGPLSGSGSALAQTDFTEKGLAKLSAGDLEKLRMYLRGMKLPRCEVAAEMFARWVQVHRDTAIKGVPVSKQSLIVDLRDVRGRNRIMPLVPSKERKRQQHQLCLLCLLGVLAVPYAYARLLQKAGIQVAGARSTNPAAWTQSATDDEVVRFLANQGLTIAEADDSWQFARNYVQAMVHEGAARTGGGRPEDVQYAGLLARVEAEVKVHGMPPGLRREADDRLVCFRGLMGYQEGVVPVFDFTEKLSALGVGSPPSQPVPKPPSPRVASPPPARLPQGPSRNGETVEREDRKYQGRAGRSYEPRAYEAQDGHRTGGVVGRGRGHNSYGAGPSRRGRERDHGHYYTAPSNSARSWRRSRSPSDQRGK
ncbi:hypothetical protein B0H16DRAFT_839035 [Mycena metata]|uniref:Uncharacterized protein n=1 Tax=Mycena metata TaxID=1033252 RepID=A0AAD7IV01_9AGAR|nr:hypothetical protein B0H16DRAFT_839035 [Mycena metata]